LPKLGGEDEYVGDFGNFGADLLRWDGGLKLVWL